MDTATTSAIDVILEGIAKKVDYHEHLDPLSFSVSLDTNITKIVETIEKADGYDKKYFLNLEANTLEWSVSGIKRVRDGEMLESLIIPHLAMHTNPPNEDVVSKKDLSAQDDVKLSSTPEILELGWRASVPKDAAIIIPKSKLFGTTTLDDIKYALDRVAIEVNDQHLLDVNSLMAPISVTLPIGRIMKIVMADKQPAKRKYFLNYVTLQIEWSLSRCGTSKNGIVPQDDAEQKLGVLSFKYELDGKESMESFEMFPDLTISQRFMTYGTTQYIVVDATKERITLHSRCTFPTVLEQRSALQKRVVEIAQMTTIVKRELNEAYENLQKLSFNAFAPSITIQTDQITVYANQTPVLHGNVYIEFKSDLALDVYALGDSWVTKMLQEDFPKD